ncbi:MAG: hypothetical protein JWP82_427, partial [Humibacillus sp.]|nr:hypothetical protein [Humibacillus sp.]
MPRVSVGSVGSVGLDGEDRAAGVEKQALRGRAEQQLADGTA